MTCRQMVWRAYKLPKKRITDLSWIRVCWPMHWESQKKTNVAWKDWTLVDLRREDIECERSRTRVDMSGSLHLFWALFFLWRNLNYEIQIFFAADNSSTFEFFYFIHFNNPQQLILLPPFFIRLCHRHCQPFRCGEPRIWSWMSGFESPAVACRLQVEKKSAGCPLIPKPGIWCDVMLQPAVCLSIFLRHLRLLTKTLYSLWKCC